MFRLPSFLENNKVITPAMARTGEKEEGFKSCTQKFPLSIPLRLNSHEVTVVPILAPMMMPMALDSFMMPELTNPTTITVVAEDDWITAVTAAPRNTARSLPEVSRSRICSILPPLALERPSPNTCMPYKKSASPPTIVSTLKKSMITSFSTYHLSIMI